MNKKLPDNLPTIPQVVSAVEQVVDESMQAGDYPALFDESHLVDTLHHIIAVAQLPTATPGQQRRAERAVCYHAGLYMQAHDLN